MKYFLCVLFTLNQCIGIFGGSILVEGDVIHRSTFNQYCEKDSTYAGNRKLTWNKTPVGTSAYPNEFCSDKNGIIPHRDCIVTNQTTPGKWLEVTGNCTDKIPTSNLTNILHQIMIKYAQNGIWDFNLLLELSTRTDEFKCIDLYLLSKALYYTTIEEYLSVLIDYFGQTMDNTLEIFTRLNEHCQNYNVGTYIMGAINVFCNSINEELNDLKRIVGRNFVFQISNPFLDDITGLALYRYKEDSFKDYEIRSIYVGETYEDVSSESLELAGYVPDDLISTISATWNEENKKDFRIIIVGFRNNKLFDLGNDTNIVSRVIGLSISNFCSQERNMLFDIYTKPVFSENNEETSDWFTVNKDDMHSRNVIKDCIYTPVTYMFIYHKKEDNESCCASRKFNYAEVTIQETKSPNKSVDYHDENEVFDILSSLSVSINNAQPETVIQALYKKHQSALRILTLTGCILSLLGLLGTVLTLVTIRKWYEKRMHTLQLKITMTFQTLIFLSNSDISYITYIILYYFILSQFSWMMLIGYSQYLKFVKVFNDNSTNITRPLLIGWLIPALVIVILIFLYPDCLFCEFCSAEREILIYFVIIPTSLIILINISIYLLVMVSISNSKAQEYGADIKEKHVRIGILLPFMLGVTWIFVFALVAPWRWFSLAGSYLFHLIAPIQAFVLFIFVVVLDKKTRLVWKTRWICLVDKLIGKKTAMRTNTNIQTIFTIKRSNNDSMR